ncbi:MULTISPECIES: DMT family transporter [unclassified Nonomuraea]|uniref:DMT family transporter n=1 Tax=unclassified Nonomuraea TaxID=2593643 RepID=UPI0033DF6A93
MLAALLATSAAVLYGTADYLGGVAARRVSALTVALFSHLTGAATVALLLLFTAGPPEAWTLARGALAGLASGLGLALFYRAMTMGAISVTAAVTSATSACVPAVYGVAAGERPDALALVGVGMAVLAIVLISKEKPGGEVPSGKGKAVLTALAAGAGFGGFFVLIPTTPTGGLWPLLAARGSSVTLIFLLVVLSGGVREMRPRGWALRPIVAAGTLDIAANILFLFAKQEGMLSLVATLSSLYPVSTLLLAGVFLDERPGRIQMAGICLALVAAIMIST